MPSYTTGARYRRKQALLKRSARVRWNSVLVVLVIKYVDQGHTTLQAARHFLLPLGGVRFAVQYWRKQIGLGRWPRGARRLLQMQTEPETVTTAEQLQIPQAEERAIRQLYAPRAVLPASLAKYAGKGPVE